MYPGKFSLNDLGPSCGSCEKYIMKANICKQWTKVVTIIVNWEQELLK